MQFLKEIRDHLANFETEAKDEIHKFIDWLHTKYIEPAAPIVSPPEVANVQSVSTFTPATDNAPVATDDIITDTPSVIVDAPATTPEVAVEAQVEADPIAPAVV